MSNRKQRRAQAAIDKKPDKAWSGQMPRFSRSPKQEFKRILRKGGKKK